MSKLNPGVRYCRARDFKTLTLFYLDRLIGGLSMLIISSRLFLVILVVTFAGCATPYGYKTTLDQNPYLTPAQVREKFGQPFSQKTYSNYNVTIYEYRPAYLPFHIVFKNDSIANYGIFDEKDWIKIYYNLGMIDEDDYRWQYSTALQEEAADREYRLERARLIQEKEIADKQLYDQRQKEYRDRMSEIFKPRTDDTIHTDCSTDSLGGVHCTSRSGL